MTTTTHLLPDDSTATVEQLDDGRHSFVSTVSRTVAGRCVWAQAFSAPHAAEHAAQIDRVVGEMRANPGGFRRWYL